MSDGQAHAGLVKQLFEADFTSAQAIWVEGFLTLLVELRRVFGNDMDKVMILSAIGQQMLRDPAMPTMPLEVANTVGPGVHSDRRTNIDALARATGIPRESVRRKVNELTEAGLVRRADDGGIVIADGAAARLATSTDVEVAMLDRIFADLLALMVRRNLLQLAQPD
jgi:hypothetical protein